MIMAMVTVGGGNSVGNAKCPSLWLRVTCLIYYKSWLGTSTWWIVCCGNVATSCHFYISFQVEFSRVKILGMKGKKKKIHLNFVLIIVQAVGNYTLNIYFFSTQSGPTLHSLLFDVSLQHTSASVREVFSLKLRNYWNIRSGTIGCHLQLG